MKKAEILKLQLQRQRLLAALASANLDYLRKHTDEFKSVPDLWDLSVKSQSVEVLELIWQTGIYPDFQYEFRLRLVLDEAARLGNFEVFKWLFEHGWVAHITTYNLAAEFGRLEILEYLWENDTHRRAGTWPGLDKAEKSDQLKIFRWYFKLLKRHDWRVNNLLNSPKILTWLKEQTVLLAASNSLADQAINDNNLELLKWLYSLGAKPQRNSISQCYELNILKWLQSKGYQMSKQKLDHALLFQHFEVAEWLWSLGNHGTSKLIKRLIDNGCVKCLDFIWNHDYTFTELDLDYAVKMQQIEIMDWMDYVGIQGSSRIAIIPSRKGYRNILVWLYSHGYPLSKSALELLNSASRKG